MKYISTLLITTLSLFASENTLTPSEHSSIHNYNNRPIIKMNKKQNMHRLHKVDEEQVTQIVKKETNEDIQKIELLHNGNILKYKVKTKSYILYVNALDGKIIK